MSVARPGPVSYFLSVAGAQSLVLGRADVVAFNDVSRDDLVVNSPQKRNAPSTARPGAEALGDLGGALRSRLLHEVDDLALLDVEAVADLAIEVHMMSVSVQRSAVSFQLMRTPFGGFSPDSAIIDTAGRDQKATETRS